MVLGACCQEYFVRKASQNYQASTHLVSQDQSGSKYKAAVKWNIPVVSGEWLFACAVTGTLVPVEDYPVGEDSADADSGNGARPSDNLGSDERSPVVKGADTESAKPLLEEVAMETSESSAEHLANFNGLEGQNVVNSDLLPEDHTEAQRHPTKRPSIYNRPFRPSFDLTDVMGELASPIYPSARGRKSRASRSSFPLDDFFAENIQQTLQKIGTVVPPVKDSENRYHHNDGDEKTNGECQEVKNCCLSFLVDKNITIELYMS